MRKMTAVALVYAALASILPAAAQQNQQQPQQAGKKLEALLNAAELPFNKSEEGIYIAVISIDQTESERFRVGLSNLGNDPNNEKLQIIQMYFMLGQIPKGASFPPALIKQMNQWNANLTMGKVVAIGNLVWYASASWLSHTDAETLAIDATLGHYVSQDLRKEIAPYLKQ